MMRLSVLLIAVGLSACGTNQYCLVQQDYQQAQVVPELRAVEGLQIPNSPSAMRLPPAPANPQPFGKRGEDGTGVCLDKPPQFNLPTRAPAPAKS